MIRDINKWLKETPVKKWDCNNIFDCTDTEIQELIKGATHSLLAYPGSVSDMLLDTTWDMLEGKMEFLKLPEGDKQQLQTATLIVTQRHPVMQNILRDYLHINYFNAYASASPGGIWEPFCFIADGSRGIIGCADGYRIFEDFSLAYALQRWVVAGHIHSGYLHPLFPTKSFEDSKFVVKEMWNPDLLGFVDGNIKKIWDENFDPVDPQKVAEMMGPGTSPAVVAKVIAEAREKVKEDVQALNSDAFKDELKGFLNSDTFRDELDKIRATLPSLKDREKKRRDDLDEVTKKVSGVLFRADANERDEPLDEADVALRKGLGVTDLDMEKYCTRRAEDTRRAERDVKEAALLKDFCLVQAWASTKQPEGDLSAKDLVTVFKGTKDGLPAINDLLKKIKEASGAEHVKVHFCLNDMDADGVIKVEGVVDPLIAQRILDLEKNAYDAGAFAQAKGIWNASLNPSSLAEVAEILKGKDPGKKSWIKINMGEGGQDRHYEEDIDFPAEPKEVTDSGEPLTDDAEPPFIFAPAEGVGPELVVRLLKAEGPKALARGRADAKAGRWSTGPTYDETLGRVKKILKGEDPDAGKVEVAEVVDKGLFRHFLRHCGISAEYQDRKKRKGSVAGVTDAEKVLDPDETPSVVSLPKDLDGKYASKIPSDYGDVPYLDLRKGVIDLIKKDGGTK